MYNLVIKSLSPYLRGVKIRSKIMATKNTTKKENKSEGEFVSKAELESFKKDVADGQNKMLDILERMSANITVPSAPTPNMTGGLAAMAPTLRDVSAEPNGFLPEQYQKIVDKHFDPADGFSARLNFPEMDDSGREMGGITFTIIVPQKFTNMSDAAQKFYKTDVRLVALRPENIIRGIDSWCGKVAKNIKYNRKAVVK